MAPQTARPRADPGARTSAPATASRSSATRCTSPSRNASSASAGGQQPHHPRHDHVQLCVRRGPAPRLRERQGHGLTPELVRLHLQRGLSRSPSTRWTTPSRTSSTARAEDQGMITFDSMLGEGKSRGFANGRAMVSTPELVRLHLLQRGLLDHRLLAGPRRLGLHRAYVWGTATPTPTAAPASPTATATHS